MQKIEIKYNPYKMKTDMKINGKDVLGLGANYETLKEFIKNDTPLQTWIEPVFYENWKGFINELVDEEVSDTIKIIFDGRKIDFNDLKRACLGQNEGRKNKIKLELEHRREISDEQLSNNIDLVMKDLLSDRFKKLVNEHNKTSQETYDNLKENYEHAKNKEFHIAFAGVYSSGKSTILNALVRKDVLPTSDKTCTSKIFKLKHDKSLGEKLSLRCLDEDGKVVVHEEKFPTDLACKKRLLEITPIGANESNPPEVDTIEIRMNLSHLYPSPALEEKLKLVIVDTPGCNSARTRSGDAGKNEHEEISLGIITAENKEMIVICADGQDYEDESIGEFLGEIAEISKEDRGYFNDRFLFVLNKCDLKKYNNGERAEEAKASYAEYLMAPDRWGLEQDEDIDFTPKIFMTSAYAALAIVKGADQYTVDEKKVDGEKRNLAKGYNEMKELIVEYSDENYFFSQLCDIPKYRQEEFKRKFETAIKNNEDARAVELQCGILCLESAIRDYIERYAYPIKVQSLLDTFEDLLDEVEKFNESEANKLKKTIDALTSKNAQKITAGKDKKIDEQRKNKLSDIRIEVTKEQQKIDSFVIEEDRINSVEKQFKETCDDDKFVELIRTEVKNKKEYTAKEKEEILTGVRECYNRAWKNVENTLSSFQKDYNRKLQESLDNLRNRLEELEREKKFEFDGYNFKNSVSYQNAMKLNINDLRKEAEKTKTKAHIRVVANPIKQQKYKWYQFFAKIDQFFAPDTIEEQVEDKYDLSFLRNILSNTNREVAMLCADTIKNYKSDCERIKKGIQEELTQLANDLAQTEKAIQVRNQRIIVLSKDINQLEAAKKESDRTVQWLQTLKRKIEEV